MAKQNPNKKLPKDHNSDGGDLKYPYFYGNFDKNGAGTLVSVPEDKEKSVTLQISHDGNWKSTSADGTTFEQKDTVREYTTGSKSSHADGQVAEYTDSNFNRVSALSSGITAGKGIVTAAGEKVVSGSGGTSFHNDTGGNSYRTSNGDLVDQRDGYMHFMTKKDFYISAEGSRYDFSNEDFLISAKENLDVLAKGKLVIGSDDALVVNSSSTMKITSTDSMSINSLATMNLTSTGAMAANTQDKMDLSAQSTMTANSQGDMKLNSLSNIKATCGITNLEMTPSSAKVSVGPMATVEMNSGSITITCGASVITLTPGGIVIATPSLLVESAGGSVINSVGPMTVTSESEAVFAGAGAVQLASGGAAAVFAPAVFIGL